MDEKGIRKILTSYLRANNPKIRIFKEKSIGGSICDLMAVTDIISGYEIKSDLDNYSRLGSQVINYNKFFNKNYIVVGEIHESSIIERIPAYWGIIVIKSDSVVISRPATNNPSLQIKRQLSILWKLELNNLLTYFNLPLYALKPKDFLIDRLWENVPAEMLSERTAYELMNRDYSVFDAKDYSELYEQEKQPEEFIDLADGVSEMEQMTLDQWIAIYTRAQQIKKAKEDIDNKRVRERPSHEITYEDIEVSPGVPWVDKKYITEFARYLLTIDGEVEYIYTRGVRTNYEPITGNWFIENKGIGNNYVSCTVRFGLARYNALYILEATLNLRDIKLQIDSSSKGEFDEAATITALEKQKLIIELFKEWIWQDEDRKWEIEEAYNKLFGKYERKEYDGSKLEFPEMDPSQELFDYQKDAVQRIIENKNTLLAFDVGAGKTFIMIAAAMKMRQEGISRKNMFVVPNNIVGQWQKIFLELYPDARLLVIDPKNFKAPVRDKAMEQMKYGDYDGIIIAYSCFEMIPVSIEYITSEMDEKVAEINRTIEYMRYESGSMAALEAEKKHIAKLSRELIASMDYDTFSITFDELEVTALFLDEAHNYKNLPIKTKMKNVRGINVTGSKKCLGMLQKIRAVQDFQMGKGVIFATGTPLSNSLADAYTMQIYLQHDDLSEYNLDKFDNWIKTFARPEKVAEVDVDTQHYRYVTRFSKFFNLPELSRMFSDIAVFHAMEKDDGLPELEEYRNNVIEKNEKLTEYMLSLADRTEKIRSGEVDRKSDNMLKVSTDGRKAALDLRLVGRFQPYETSKVTRCIANVKSIYDQYEDCSQLVFCDYSTPKHSMFNVYDAIKEGLMEWGIPENEIAFIHSYHTEERKLALYRKVNEGTVRVLIGSTFKLGIGANVQTKLKAIHHLDVPWRPADMIQREGRILRKGNEHESVFIYRYVCEGSFDAYSWQILESKQRFISQFLMGSAYQRSASDLEESVLSFAEVKALALADPRMKVLSEKENELTNLLILNNKYVETTKSLEKESSETEKSIAILENQIRGTEENCLFVKEKSDKDYKLFRQIIEEFLTPELTRMPENNMGTAWGFMFTTPKYQESDKMHFIISRADASYTIECGDSAAGNAVRATNLLRSLPERLKTLQDTLEEKNRHLIQINRELEKKNPYREQINCLKLEVNHLRGQIEE